MMSCYVNLEDVDGRDGAIADNTTSIGTYAIGPNSNSSSPSSSPLSLSSLFSSSGTLSVTSTRKIGVMLLQTMSPMALNIANLLNPSLRMFPSADPRRFCEVGDMYKHLNLQEVTGPSAFSHADLTTLGFPSTSNVYEMKVQWYHKNLMGKMHGGAVAAAIEEACVLTRNKHNHANLDVFVRALDVNYLSPSKGELLIVVSEDDHWTTPSRKSPTKSYCSKSRGKVLNKKDNSVCVEFTCYFHEAE